MASPVFDVPAATLRDEKRPFAKAQTTENSPRVASAAGQVNFPRTPRRLALVRSQEPTVTILDVGSSGRADLTAPGSPRLSYSLQLSLQNFTLCLWVKPHRLHQIDNVVYIGDSRRRHFAQLALSSGTVTLHTTRCHQRFEVLLGVRVWHHLCVALGQGSTLYHNGMVLSSAPLCAADQGIENFLVEQFIIGGSLWGSVPFSGVLADVRLFDAVLTEDQVRAVAEGLAVAVPVFEADNSSFRNLSGVAIGVEFGAVDLRSLTSVPSEQYYFYFKKKVNYTDGKDLCKNIGGSQVTVTENNTQNITDVLLKYSEKMEAEVMDLWVHVPVKPRNNTLTTCPLLHVYQDPPALIKEEGDCEVVAAVLCHLPKTHRLRLLGPKEEIILYPMNDNINVFEDGGNYRLKASDVSLQLENVQSEEILYERTLSSSKQLTGRHKWRVTKSVAENNNETEISLALTACGESQFTCSSGDCVLLEDVCDLVNDCQDATDEVLCANRMILPSTYNKLLSPSQGTLSHVLVGLEVILEQVNHVELTENLLEVVIRVNVFWRDPRIVFKYLKQNVSVMLMEEAVKEMWLPSVDMVTALPDCREKTDFPNNKDKTVTATARTGGHDTLLGDAEVRTFPGALTDLQAGRADEIKFMCRLDLFYYPFDVQVCKMPLKLKNQQVTDAIWNPSQVSVDLGEHLILTLLYVHNFSISVNSDNDTAIIVVKLGRNNAAYIINTLLPCMVLEMIGFLTHAFPIKDFTNRCTATLSCLIVKAAFFLQISGTLPTSAEPKLVDVWMFGNVFVLSLIFVAHVAVLHAQRRLEASQSASKKGSVAWDEEELQSATQNPMARYVNLVGLMTSMVVCIALLSGIGAAVSWGKAVALEK